MNGEPPMRPRDWLPALGLLVASFCGLAVFGCQPLPGQRQLAVLAPPWDGPVAIARLVAAAGGALVGPGGMPNVMIAASDDPGFSRALYRAGAWLVMNPLALHGCAAARQGAS